METNDNVLNYQLGVCPINIVEPVSDLGVIVDSHRDFSESRTAVIREAHQRANSMRRCFTSKQDRETL